jgi:chromosome segregation ATPase
MAASALGASIVAARETHQRSERELKRLHEAARNAKKRARTLKDELKSARKSAKQARKKLRKAIAAHERATLLLNQARAGAAHSGAALGVAKAAQPKVAVKPAQPKVAQKPAPRKKRPIQRHKVKTTRKSQRQRPEVVAPEAATTATDANAAALGSVETVLPTAESAVE